MKQLGFDKKTKWKKTRTAHYRFWHALYLSFFSGRLYVDVIKRWRGLGLCYILFMLSVVTLPYAVSMMNEYQRFSEETLLEPAKKLPPFVVRHGTVHFHHPMPYFVRNNHNEVVAIIDTTGEFNHLPQGMYPKVTTLVTKHALHLYFPEFELFKVSPASNNKEKVWVFDKQESFSFIAEDWLEEAHFPQIQKVLTLLLYPIFGMFYFGVYATVLLAIALFGQFIAKYVFKVVLTFKESARLTMVAATPQTFIYFGLLALNLVYPGTGLLYIVLLTAYFSFGVLAYRRENKVLALQ